MTEKEKMQRHVLYDANYDEELIEERKVAPTFIERVSYEERYNRF